MTPTMTDIEHSSLNQHARRGHYYYGWGEQGRRRRSHMTHDGNLSLNHAAQYFEPRTEDTRLNLPQQRPPNCDSGDISNN
jgi:hypothetical protein